MLSTAKIRGSSWRYYQDTVAHGACEYFLGHNDTPGRWHGNGLTALGMTAGREVTERDLEALFGRALSPTTGARLGRGWRADAVTGYDLTFSAPKSVSALWALGDTTTVTAIEDAHAAAVHAALGYLQAHAANSRRGRDGVDQISTAGYAAALFDHRTSRTGDPQLHTHCLVVNKLHCDDGVWRTLDGYDLFHHKKSAGVLHQAALRAELESRLPVVFGEVNQHGQADIRGVPEDLMTVWSTRTSAVLADAVPTIAAAEDHLGRPVTSTERARIIKTAVISTRPAKEPDVTEEDLRARWLTQADTTGYSSAQVTAAVRDASARASGTTRFASERTHDLADVRPPHDSTPRDPAPPVVTDERWRDHVIVDAVTAVGRTTAMWSRANLTAQIAARLPRMQDTSGLPRSAADIVGLVEHLTDSALATASSGAVELGAVQQGATARVSDTRYASQELIDTEARIVDRALTHGFRDPASIPAPVVEAAMAAAPVAVTWEQQRVAIRLVGSKDLVTVLTAPAGAGKTTTLAAAVRMWHDTGVAVTALAPSARAASELADATGTPGRTVASWLRQQQNADPIRGFRFGQHPVLLVDEASMLSTADLDQLTAYAEVRRMRLVLVGDPGQIGAVNAPGGMFEHLVDRLGPWAAELTELHRFRDLREGHASLDLRAGNADGLRWYASQDRIHPHADAQDAADAVFTHWQTAIEEGKDALMVARGWTDVTALNARARAVGIATGAITGPDLLTLTTRSPSTRPEARSWRAGDILTAKKNNPSLRVGDTTIRNGDRFRVMAAVISQNARVEGLVVEDLAGRGTTTLPVKYLAKHAEYGWASTIDGAQGATVDIGILLARNGLDREHLYVAITRGRDSNHVHTTPDAPLGDAGPHRHRLSAHRADSHDEHGRGQLRFPDLDIEPAPEPVAPDMTAAIAQLAAAVRTSGREQAAHTLLTHVDRAADHLWQFRDDQVPPRPVPDEHTRRQRDLASAIARRNDATARARYFQGAVTDTEDQLQVLSFWSRGKRRELEPLLLAQQQDLAAAVAEVEQAADGVTSRTGPVEVDTAERHALDTEDRGRHRTTWLARLRRPYTHPTVKQSPWEPDAQSNGRRGTTPTRPTRRPTPAHGPTSYPPPPEPPSRGLYR